MMSLITILIGIIAIFIAGYTKQKELFRFLVQRNFTKFKFGTLCLVNSETNSFIKFGNNQKAFLTLTDHSTTDNCDAVLNFENTAQEDEFYKILVLHGGATGLGETYMNGIWNITNQQDLGNTLYHIMHNTVHGRGAPIFEYLLSFNHWYYQFKRKYLITKSRQEDIESISKHYDLDNKFYQSFLGNQLSGYSCGFFNEYGESVYDAQDNKWNVIINKLSSLLPNKMQSFDASYKTIDIGSGWGYFASYLNNKTSSKSYGITISKQQYEFSLNEYARQIKSGDVNFELLDYRDLGEKYPDFFDFAVSVGMVEHVGLKKLNEFFENAYNSLKPDSYFLLHYVARTDIFPNWRGTKRSNACSMSNFISEYIFPGGCILHKDWVHEQAELNGFTLVHSESYGMHYMRTLQEWRNNFMNNWTKYSIGGKHKNNEQLKRMYEFYFAFCESAFRTQRINLLQQLYYKPKEAKEYTSELTFKKRVVNPNPQNI